MAKKSSIEKNNRRRKLSKHFSGRRSRLKAIARDKTKPMEERFAATLKLAELPRNSSTASDCGRVLAGHKLDGRWPRHFRQVCAEATMEPGGGRRPNRPTVIERLTTRSGP